MRTLKFGVKGDDVAAWQRFLQSQNLLNADEPDGIFGQETLTATVAFQRQHGLVPDGVVGQATITIAQETGFQPVQVTDLAGLVAIPSGINAGLSPAHLQTMLSLFGQPGQLTSGCSRITNAELARETVTESVGPFRVTGWQPAVARLRDIFTQAAAAEPEVVNQVQTAGMSCVRRVAGSQNFSNHSFGTAVDLFFGPDVDPRGDPHTQLGILKLAPFFHSARWYWGAGFPTVDSMHFEMSDELIREVKGGGSRIVVAPDFVAPQLVNPPTNPPVGIPIRLPDYAQDVLSAAQGVPWSNAGAMPQYSGYLGMMPGSLFYVFHNLVGLPGVTSAAFYECKLSSDNDGSASPDDADPSFHDPDHQNNTSLHDASGKALNAFVDAYAVLPLDQSETSTNKHGLPDFGADLGLRIGDVGVAFWRESNSGAPRQCFYIYGDKGPAVKLGEGSVKMEVQLGVPGAEKGNGHEASEIIAMHKGIIHIGFIGSGTPFLVPGHPDQTTLDATGVIALGQKLFAAFKNQPV